MQDKPGRTRAQILQSVPHDDGKGFLNGFYNAIVSPSEPPPPQLFTKTFHTTDIPQFLPDFTLRMLLGEVLNSRL